MNVWSSHSSNQKRIVMLISQYFSWWAHKYDFFILGKKRHSRGRYILIFPYFNYKTDLASQYETFILRSNMQNLCKGQVLQQLCLAGGLDVMQGRFGTNVVSPMSLQQNLSVTCCFSSQYGLEAFSTREPGTTKVVPCEPGRYHYANIGQVMLLPGDRRHYRIRRTTHSRKLISTIFKMKQQQCVILYFTKRTGCQEFQTDSLWRLQPCRTEPCIANTVYWKSAHHYLALTHLKPGDVWRIKTPFIKLIYVHCFVLSRKEGPHVYLDWS